MSYLNGASNAASQQFEGMKAIPGALLMNWPVFFGFYAVEAVYAVALNFIPRMGGTVGMFENIALSGATEVLRFVTWEKLRAH